MDNADRQRRSAEQELGDIIEELSDATLANQALQSAKRKLDSDMQTLHVSYSIFVLGFLMSVFTTVLSDL